MFPPFIFLLDISLPKVDKSKSLRNLCNLVLCKEREEVVGDWAWFIDEPKAGRGLPLVGFHSHAHVEIEKSKGKKQAQILRR